MVQLGAGQSFGIFVDIDTRRDGVDVEDVKRVLSHALDIWEIQSKNLGPLTYTDREVTGVVVTVIRNEP